MTNSLLNNTMDQTFYDMIDDFLGSGGGINKNKSSVTSGGGAIILRGSAY